MDMSLSRILISSVQGSAKIDETNKNIVEESVEPTPYQYNHEIGARLIAMETAEELHDIFLESFYGVEQADILAIRDGVALEGSQYEVIVEGLARNAISRIVEILKNLWKKISGFFKSVMMHIKQITMSGKKFFEKYEEEFSQLRGLSGFKYTTYEWYDDAIDNFDTDLVKHCTTSYNEIYEIITMLLNVLELDAVHPDNTEIVRQSNDGEEEVEQFMDYMERIINQLHKLSDSEILISTATRKTAKNTKELNIFLYNVFRGLEYSLEKVSKKELEIPDVYGKILTIKNFNPNPIMKIYDITEKLMTETIKGIEQVEHDSVNAVGPVVSKLSEACRLLSNAVAIRQSMQNTFITAWKNAVKDRDKDYKHMALSALSFVRKNK